MKITCDSCGAKYTIADDKVRGRKVKIRCKGCGTAIVVDGQQEQTSASTPPDASGGPDAETVPMDVGASSAPPASSDGRWSVNLSETDQRTLSTQELVDGWKSGVVTADAFVWKEGMADWLPAGKVPELQALLSPPAPPVETPYAERPIPASPYGPPAAQPYQAAVGPISQGQAIASMVCGIVSLVICCLWFVSGPLAIVAIALGHVAISKAKKDPARFGGKGMARAGLITGYIGLVCAIVMLLFGLWAQNLTPDQINRLEFFPPEVRQKLIEQQELQERLKQSQP